MGKKDEKTKTTKKESFMGPWPGPPGCICDLTKPARDRCTKGGWLRCKGAYNAMLAQYRYRDKAGAKGGEVA